MDWNQVRRELLKNPEVKREYDALEAEFQLASSIIERRLAKGLTQRQLANRIGTKQPVISRLESHVASVAVWSEPEVATTVIWVPDQP